MRQVQRVRERQISHCGDRPPSDPQRHWRVRGQFFNHGIDGCVELSGRNHLVDNVKLLRFQSRKPLREKTHLVQAAPRNHPHQHRQNHHREYAYLGFGGAKLGTVNGHCEVAGAHQSQAAAKRAAIDAGDDGQIAAVHGAEHFGDGVVEAAWLQREWRTISGWLELSPGAKGLIARAAQNNRAYAVHGFGQAQRADKLLHNQVGHGVVLGGAVDRHVACSPALFNQQLGKLVRHAPSFTGAEGVSSANAAGGWYCGKPLYAKLRSAGWSFHECRAVGTPPSTRITLPLIKPAACDNR